MGGEIHNYMDNTELRKHLADRHGMNTDWAAKHMPEEAGKLLNATHNREHKEGRRGYKTHPHRH